MAERGRIFVSKQIDMETPLFFYDPFGNTRLSGEKTLLFCSFHGFTIPHDIAGAILYSKILEEAKKVDFSNVLDIFIPSLRSLVDTGLFLPALAKMGYQDLVDEFNRLDEEMRTFMEARFSKEPYNIQIVVEKLEDLLPAYSVPYFPHFKDAYIKRVCGVLSERVWVYVSLWEEDEGCYGVLSLNGDLVLAPIYKNIWSQDGRYYEVESKDGARRVWEAERNTFLDKIYNRNIISVLFSDTAQCLLIYQGEDKHQGLMRLSGELLTPPIYDRLYEYGPYILAGNLCKIGALLDINGKEILVSEYDDFVLDEEYQIWRDSGVEYDLRYFPVRSGDEWFFVDTDGLPISGNSYYGLGPFTTNGYARIQDAAGRFGVIDRNEREVIPPGFVQLSWSGPDALEAFTDNNVIMLISPTGENLLPEGWTYNQWHDGNYVTARREGSRAVFARNEVSGRFDKLMFETNHSLLLENGHVIMFDEDQKRYLLAYDGTPILQKGYDEICFWDDPTRFIVKDGPFWFLINEREEIIREYTIERTENPVSYEN